MPKKLNNKIKKIEVIIPIDTIDDIYSDFDLRDIKIRSLSTDFIHEVKTQSGQTEDESQIYISILAPESIRKTELTQKIENHTKKRIKKYFENEYIKEKNERRNKIIRSFIFIIAGMLCFSFSKYFSDHKFENIFVKIVFELITFFSWFATWNGIDTLGESKSIREINHLKRIAESKIQFQYIEKFSSISM